MEGGLVVEVTFFQVFFQVEEFGNFFDKLLPVGKSLGDKVVDSVVVGIHQFQDKVG